MKNIYKSTILIGLLTVVFSCGDLLNNDPINEISSETALSDFSGVQSALLGGYDKLQVGNYYGYQFTVGPELLADNMRIALQNTNRLVQQAVNAEGAHLEALYGDAYALINRVNNVLESVDKVKDGSAQQKAQVKGAAYFLRALAHFDLVRVFGRNPRFLQANSNGNATTNALGIPIITSAFSGLNGSSFPARNTVVQVYAQVESDLDQAIILLDNSKAPFFASKIAAKALKARVSLYQGKWSAAATLANEAITESDKTLASNANYRTIFSADAESIFSIKFSAGESLGVNTALSAFYVVSGDAVLRQDMIDQFAVGDVRGSANLIQTVVKGPETVRKTLKFNSYGGAQGIDNIPILRLSELYLIRAEANFENNSSIGDSPLNDVNAIHTRAGLLPLGSVTMSDILNERRLEMAFEGHRFFDLVRRGLDVPKGIQGVDCVSECNIPNGDYRIVAKFAQGELDTNSNLVQNPQYR